MSLTNLLLIVLIILAIASIPTYPYSRGWGYSPLGGIVGILLIVVVLRFLGII